MAGSSHDDKRHSYVIETTPGTTPATPAFRKLPFDSASFMAMPKVKANRIQGFDGQRTGVSRSGFTVTGSAKGPLIYGVADDFLASLLQGSWSSDVLVNARTKSEMTIEQSVPQGEGGALAHTRFRGMEVTSGTITLTAGEDAALSFEFMGLGSDDATATLITGATYADPTNLHVLGSGDDIGTITMAGLTLDCMKSLTISLSTEGRDEQPKLSSNDLCGISQGAFLPELTGEFFVEANFIAIYNKSREQDPVPFQVQVPIGSVTGEKYLLNFPKCTFVENKLPEGDSGSAFHEFKILPQYDSGIDGTLEITRAVS